ncbi:hypothetical protein SAMN05216480_1169 [Pustulibacterium marinum]|uniref:Uncharacterized protein n=1 Tax=Pustulibacterium marinum TaxID=1224947 RepID=A0A1I7IG24_9FLAO|nr:hypothetical protein [Pustulibacterium marinum]SFU71868.1 hypothetical protein SAMN05216480_1169 [Pustulibacterium marinum]
MKKLLHTVLILVSLSATAQVGINTETPDANSAIDINGKTIIRDVPNDYSSTDILVLGADNVVSKGKQPVVLAFPGMQVPACQTTSVGSTGSFSVTINSLSYTVNWEILEKNVGSGVGYNNGTYVLADYPITAQSLVVDYTFSPALPFTPDGVMFTAYNNSSFPDSFSFSYSDFTTTDLTVRISRTDISSADGSENCWLSSLNRFNMMIFKN